MDPKKIAEEIMEQLFTEQEETLLEEMDEEEEESEEGEEEYDDSDDDSGEEYDDSDDDSGEEYQESEDSYETEEMEDSGSGDSGKNTSSIAMKPSMASASMVGGKVTQVDSDLSGKGSKDALGKGQQEFSSDISVDAGKNQATLQMKPVDFSLDKSKLSEDIKILFGGNEELSEEFVNKATDLYEASMMSNLQAITEELTNQYQEALVEQVDDVRAILEEQIDQYLSYVVEEWMKENALTVENGLRTEIAEEFINNLKNLFEASYISVPEEKTDLVAEMMNSVENYELRINEEIQKNIELKEHIDAITALNIFMEETQSLNNLDIEKVRSLVENLEYENESDFRDKVQVIVEGYVKNKNSGKTSSKISKIIEQVQNTSVTEEIQPLNEKINMYSHVLDRSLNG
jgi:hypothetical protein